MKLCVDCKHYIKPITIKVNVGYILPEYGEVPVMGAQCNAVVTLTFGGPVPITEARLDEQDQLYSDVCGREGKYWEAK